MLQTYSYEVNKFWVQHGEAAKMRSHVGVWVGSCRDWQPFLLQRRPLRKQQVLASSFLSVQDQSAEEGVGRAWVSALSPQSMGKCSSRETLGVTASGNPKDRSQSSFCASFSGDQEPGNCSIHQFLDSSCCVLLYS